MYTCRSELRLSVIDNCSCTGLMKVKSKVCQTGHAKAEAALEKIGQSGRFRPESHSYGREQNPGIIPDGQTFHNKT